MGLIKPSSGLTETQIIDLIGLHAPTTEGVNESKVIELIRANDNTGYTEEEIIQLILNNVPTTEGVNESRVLELIQNNIGESLKLTVGTYEGNGNNGSSNKNTLTFDFIPKLVIVSSDYVYSNYAMGGIPWINGEISGWVSINQKYEVYLTWKENSVSWYGSNREVQLNTTGVTYHYIAIG